MFVQGLGFRVSNLPHLESWVQKHQDSCSASLVMKHKDSKPSVVRDIVIYVLGFMFHVLKPRPCVHVVCFVFRVSCFMSCVSCFVFCCFVFVFHAVCVCVPIPSRRSGGREWRRRCRGGERQRVLQRAPLQHGEGRGTVRGVEREGSASDVSHKAEQMPRAPPRLTPRSRPPAAVACPRRRGPR